MKKTPIIEVTCTQCNTSHSLYRDTVTSVADTIMCTSCSSPIKIVQCTSCFSVFSINLRGESQGDVPFTCRTCGETFMISLNEKIIEDTMGIRIDDKEEITLEPEEKSKEERNLLTGGLHHLISSLTFRSFLISLPASLLMTLSIQILGSRVLSHGSQWDFASRGWLLVSAIATILYISTSMVLSSEESNGTNNLDPGKAFGGAALTAPAVLLMFLGMPEIFRWITTMWTAWPAMTIILSLVTLPLTAALLILTIYTVFYFPVISSLYPGLIGSIKHTYTFTWFSVSRIPKLLALTLTLGGALFLLSAGVHSVMEKGLDALFSYLSRDNIVTWKTVTLSRLSIFRPPFFMPETIVSGDHRIGIIAGILHTTLSIALTSFLLIFMSAISRILYLIQMKPPGEERSSE